MVATHTVSPTSKDLHNAFLSILPKIQLHGSIYFRGVRCHDRRQDLIAEMAALAWKWFVQLARQGKDATQFPSAIASYAARAVNAGRRLCGQERANDVLSPATQRQHQFVVDELANVSTLSRNPLTDALLDNTQTPPDEQAAFRIDFPAWLKSLDNRKRRIAQDMAYGHRTKELATSYGTTHGRISQLRREFHTDWERFCAARADSVV
jgi:hypothetical protein